MRTIIASIIRVGVVVGLLGMGSVYAQADKKYENLTGMEKERCLLDAGKK
jgi:hypothetical protein